MMADPGRAVHSESADTSLERSSPVHSNSSTVSVDQHQSQKQQQQQQQQQRANMSQAVSPIRPSSSMSTAGAALSVASTSLSPQPAQPHLDHEQQETPQNSLLNTQLFQHPQQQLKQLPPALQHFQSSAVWDNGPIASISVNVNPQDRMYHPKPYAQPSALPPFSFLQPQGPRFPYAQQQGGDMSEAFPPHFQAAHRRRSMSAPPGGLNLLRTPADGVSSNTLGHDQSNTAECWPTGGSASMPNWPGAIDEEDNWGTDEDEALVTEPAASKSNSGAPHPRFPPTFPAPHHQQPHHPHPGQPGFSLLDYPESIPSPPHTPLILRSPSGQPQQQQPYTFPSSTLHSQLPSSHHPNQFGSSYNHAPGGGMQQWRLHQQQPQSLPPSHMPHHPRVHHLMYNNAARMGRQSDMDNGGYQQYSHPHAPIVRAGSAPPIHMTPNSPSLSSPNTLLHHPQQSPGVYVTQSTPPVFPSQLFSANNHSFRPNPHAEADENNAVTQLQPSNDPPRKMYRCPKEGCVKIYKNTNGLKYHLEQGRCDIDGDKTGGVITGILAGNRPSDHSFGNSGGLGHSDSSVPGVQSGVQSHQPGPMGGMVPPRAPEGTDHFSPQESYSQPTFGMNGGGVSGVSPNRQQSLAYRRPTSPRQPVGFHPYSRPQQHPQQQHTEQHSPQLPNHAPLPNAEFTNYFGERLMIPSSQSPQHQQQQQGQTQVDLEKETELSDHHLSAEPSLVGDSNFSEDGTDPISDHQMPTSIPSSSSLASSTLPIAQPGFHPHLQVAPPPLTMTGSDPLSVSGLGLRYSPVPSSPYQSQQMLHHPMNYPAPPPPQQQLQLQSPQPMHGIANPYARYPSHPYPPPHFPLQQPSLHHHHHQQPQPQQQQHMPTHIPPHHINSHPTQTCTPTASPIPHHLTLPIHHPHHHPYRSMTSAPFLQSPPTPPPSDRPYWCKVPTCGKRYKNLNGLKYHAKAVHPTLDFKDHVKGGMAKPGSAIPHA
ncbi:hypothetical protein DFS34DRAFT_691045 [Phlyctochytrium arcticum]|nr:hypothetical protein DFS34DRAFT_691045 [Phlyctochytrium arcticum]